MLFPFGLFDIPKGIRVDSRARDLWDPAFLITLPHSAVFSAPASMQIYGVQHILTIEMREAE